MQKHMRAAVLHRPGDIRVEDVPVPELQPGHAILKVAAVGVCGSDIPRMLTKGTYRMPMICGHEFSGHVVSKADDVSHVALGDLVTVPPLLPCYHCEQCLLGFPSRCLNYDYFGSRRDGAYAEYVSVPSANLLKVPENLDPVGASLCDPASIARHALGKTGLRAGQRLAVVGCGPIGLLAIQWARIFGVTQILAVDVNEQKIAMARQAGATEGGVGSVEEFAGRWDVVFEGSGHPGGINQVIRLVKAGGHAVFVGIPVEDVTLENKTFAHFLRQEVSLHGSWNSFSAPYPGEEWTMAVENLASGRLRWDFMISHDEPVDQLPAVFEGIKKRQPFSKIIFRP